MSLPFRRSPLARLSSSLGGAMAGRSARSQTLKLRAGVRCLVFCTDQRGVEVDKALRWLGSVGHRWAPVCLAANLQKVAWLVIIHVRPKLNHVLP